MFCQWAFYSIVGSIAKFNEHVRKVHTELCHLSFWTLSKIPASIKLRKLFLSPISSTALKHTLPPRYKDFCVSLLILRVIEVDMLKDCAYYKDWESINYAP